MANVSVKRSGQGFTIEVSGAPNVDAKTVEGCINEAINCGCLMSRGDPPPRRTEQVRLELFRLRVIAGHDHDRH
jgi:hypothetical protein